MALDYASILSAGQSLVPNLRELAMQRQEMDARTQETDLRRQAFELKLTEAQREREREAAFEQERNQILLNPDPKRVALLALKYPEQFKGAKEGFDLLDAERRTNDLTQMGSVYSLAKEGDFASAAKMLRTRVDADKAAGQDVTSDEALLAALESDDPVQQRAAVGTIAMHIAATAPKEFAETWGKLSGGEGAAPTDLEKKYRFLIGERGQAYADQWLSEQTQDVVVGQPGAPVYRKSDIIGGSGFAPQPEGGDQSTGGQVLSPQAVREAVSSGDWSGLLSDPLRGKGGVPIAGGKYGARRDYGAHSAVDLTGEEGTPAFSAGVTGVARVSKSPKGGNTVTIDHGGGLVTRYMHLGRVDVRDGQQVTADTPIGTLGKTGRASGPNLHFEVRVNGKPVDPSRLGAIRVVRTIQEAQKLKPGTVYRTPDGRTLRR